MIDGKKRLIFSIYGGFMLNRFKRITALILAAALIFALSGCKPVYEVTITELKGTVEFHTETQAQYLKDLYLNATEYARGREELSRPNPVVLKWKAGAKANGFSVIICEKGDLSLKKTYETTEEKFELYNLKADTEYTWWVEADFGEHGKAESETWQFKTTALCPRNIYVYGVTNFRDLGGWKTSGGGKVEQGLVYRSGRLNVSYSSALKYNVTQKGIDVMLSDLGIKSEIDLRRTDNGEVGGISSSPLGESVNYFSCPMNYEGNCLLNNAEAIKKIFSILADGDNYPLFFHCDIGTDRTGFIALMLGGILGVNEEDLYRDYLFSNFGKIGSKRSVETIEANYLHTVNEYDGETLNERISACLSDLGVPASDVEAIRSILLSAE